MKNNREIVTDVTNQTGAQIGNIMSESVQKGTDITHTGMDLFRAKGIALEKVGYEQGKGNLFEFIEGAKLQRNLANAGEATLDRFPVTDVSVSKGGFGEHTAPDDFRLVRNGKVISKGQAKINNNPKDTAKNFANPKYRGMQRNTVSDNVKEVREELDSMFAKGEISRSAYNDAYKNLNDLGALTDPETGITSGGTSIDELKQFKGADGKISKNAIEKYAKRFEMKQYAKEISTTAVNTASATAIIQGIVSTTENMFLLLKNEKELSEALKDIGADVGKGATRGGLIGVLSSAIRIGGSKNKIPVISDGSAATVIAGGIIDGGVAIYDYAKGEIDEKQLKVELENTIIKSSATIYFTKASELMFGANAFVPIAIYSAASYVVALTREISENARLNATEHRRITALNEESLTLLKEYRATIATQMNKYKSEQKTVLNGFLHTFEHNIATGENYDNAIYSIINFASQTGMILQHTDFNEFKDAMNSKDSFVLG